MRGMLLGAALALGGILVGFAFATKTDALAEAKWWDLMTAWGTVAATAVALGIALRTEYLQSRRDKAVALVVWRAVTAECSQTKAFLWQAQQVLEASANEEDGASLVENWKSLATAREGIQLELGKALLPNLYQVDDVVRRDAVAKVVGLIPAYRHGILMVLALNPVADTGMRETMKLLHLMGADIEQAVDAINSGVDIGKTSKK